MVIEVAVIGRLTFHILFNVFEIPFSCNKFPMKQLQLAPCPLDPVPAPIDFDLSRFGQGEPVNANLKL